MANPPETTQVSVINPENIRKSNLGNYLESVNTQNTWVSTIQQKLSLSEVSFSLLDFVYVGAGVAGILLIPLAAGSVVALVSGATLIGVASVGLSEEERRAKLGSAIVGGAAVITNPGAATFVLRESYQAAKETAKSTVVLANSAIGLGTATLGFGTAVVTASLLTRHQKRKHQGPKNHPKKKKRVK